MVNSLACNAGDPGSIPGSGRSPGEGNDNPLQYSCLENPMDGGAWQAAVHGISKSWTQLSNFTFFLSFTCSFRPVTFRTTKITQHDFLPPKKIALQVIKICSKHLLLCDEVESISHKRCITRYSLTITKSKARNAEEPNYEDQAYRAYLRLKFYQENRELALCTANLPMNKK